ncbi:D-alanyl-D-alanine carboxypeptidase [Candidatus Nomurabacteria bacterium]|nr:D-alanyl-D-alanine carboxypeptidase [Candidatus Nomurabacteria bacterium]
MKQKLFIFWLISLALVAGLIFLADSRPLVSSAEVELNIPEPIVKLKTNSSPPALGARAFISMALAPDGRTEVLVEKDAHQRWPIASITKFFTASVALNKYLPDQVITLAQADLPENVDRGFLRLGDSFRVNDLLIPLLLESSNNSAVALARAGGDSANFIRTMNDFAAELNLNDTTLFNPNGLDPEIPGGVNYSSVHDLAMLGKWLIRHRPELLAATRDSSAVVRQSDGSFHHQAESTNILLKTEPWSGDIIGGKTGQTDLAGKNLLLILRPTGSLNYLVNVILGSPDHFAEMSELTNWIYKTYQL